MEYTGDNGVEAFPIMLYQMLQNLCIWMWKRVKRLKIVLGIN